MTSLCVPIFVSDLAQARRDAARAAEAGADIVEYRIDRFTDPPLVRQLVEGSVLPCIVTCRPVEEGGHCQEADEARLAALEAAATGSTRYLDLELQTAQRHPDWPVSRPLIVSSHDFAGRPNRLNNLILQMNQGPGQINKIVWTARTVRDNLEAFEILRSRQKPTIAFCMGEPGLISRILCRKFGGFLTFASLRPDAGTAPGQPPISELKTTFRWDRIGPRTRVYGVVGQPIAHSMSPAIHNAAFDATGHDGVYLPLLVEGSYESFKAFMESFLAFEGLDLRGLSITIPHKENALRYLTQKGARIEPLAQSIGAVNTLAVDDDGSLRGLNTDYAAILDCITTGLSIGREQLADLRIAVIGAGGTGRTAVAALAHYGATVVVHNRTIDRAQALADEFDGKMGKIVAAPLDSLCKSCCQVYVNTTSVGMHPNVNASIFGDRPPRLAADTLVFDTVYNPMETLLLRQARAAGARTVSGVEMFVRQAVGQFQAWTGLPAPVQVMRSVVESRLPGRTD